MTTLYRACMDSPVGRLTCICTNASIIRLLWASDNEDEEADQLSRMQGSTHVSAANTVADTVCRELDAYFEGQLKAFSVPPAFVYGSPFSRKVWQAIAAVPYGQTVSYQQLAADGGVSGARAAGNAVGRNPIPILVPCHRVLRKSGELGGFSGGVQVKRLLLRLEGISFNENEPQRFIKSGGDTV
ncbi:methylated-DNA--[protein]-cysteine S-methyltransferase [Ethanoligenens harbinense]|uniref:Methylated-DNA--protein-cysteine methyltransferase n=1 Tax=Ethanoligenens harbinense (strain DSM 18485 / JCM 12961 / CGMCC 1.5033 / YUAN-3) TaxID=663278 RepID=E6U6Y2_ETHHY|nr:methylated-DNA--[protein]-cysteine S-methyltransferase [Ethanoligenens harbinense]ADU26949.1 methylated-DNA/protein-cysteine methyltransferase [Ethanoligenens harbinense YUAN-3]